MCRLAMALLASCVIVSAATAQGVGSKAAVDAIVGSEVQEEQARTAVDAAWAVPLSALTAFVQISSMSFASMA